MDTDSLHADLVQRAVRWLYNTRRCSIVLAECGGFYVREEPDAIGWNTRGHSIMVECKTSVSDYYADARKPAQRMGAERYYLTPPGLLKGKTLQEGWGWIVAHPKRIVMVAKSAPQERSWIDPVANELRLLVSEMARCGEPSYGPRRRVGLQPHPSMDTRVSMVPSADTPTRSTTCH